MASENRDWGYDRIAGALANLGYEISDQTVGNVLRRHGLPPAPERKRTTTWAAFIRTHLALLAGTDFFTAEVLTLRGLVTYYVLFFIHLESRRVDIAGLTVHPNEAWMVRSAVNVWITSSSSMSIICAACCRLTFTITQNENASLARQGLSGEPTDTPFPEVGPPSSLRTTFGLTFRGGCTAATVPVSRAVPFHNCALRMRCCP
jgi:hypothetical protein